jgi:predicted HD superfamily hydrolase involved in NAD metabolism
MWRQIDLLKEQLKQSVSERRYLHSLEVAEYSVILAKRFGADPVKAEAIGILHDYCKDWDPQLLEKYIRESEELPTEILEYGKAIWHGPVASLVIQQEFGITDPEFINAVRFHSNGRAGMGLQEKIICVSDYIEPTRDFAGIEEIRVLAENNLDQAAVAVFDGAIKYLIKKKMRIYPLTLEARNYLLKEIEGNKREEAE